MPYGLSTATNQARSLQGSGEQLPGRVPLPSHTAFESFIGIDKIRKLSAFKTYFLHCKKLQFKNKDEQNRFVYRWGQSDSLGVYTFPSTDACPIYYFQPISVLP